MCEINQPIIKNFYSLEYDELNCEKTFTEEEKFYPIRYLEKINLTTKHLQNAYFKYSNL